MSACSQRRLYSCCLVSLWFVLAAGTALGLDPHDPLSHYGRQSWQAEHGLPQNTVRAIVQTADGYIWAGTEGGLARFDGVRFSVFNIQSTPELKSNDIRALAQDHDGALWIATGGGVTRIRNGQFQTFGRETGLPSSDVETVYVDDSGAVHATTASGTARFDGHRFVSEFGKNPGSQAATDCPAGFASGHASTCLKDRHGVVWVGTDSGLFRDEAGSIDRFPSGDTLSSLPILSLFEDREGNLWVGTDSGGLNIVRDQKFSTYTFHEDPSANKIRCVFADRKGVVWIGTDGGGLRRFENGAFSALTTQNGLVSNVILALNEDNSGNLLAGTPDGLNRIGPHLRSVVTSADGLAEDFVRSLYTDKDGSIWAGTRRGLSHVEGNVVTTYTQSNGLGSDLVGAIVRDTRGELWVATLHGLARFRNGAFTNYTVEDGLSSNVITDLYADPEGYLWIATQGGGLNRFHDEGFVRFSAAGGIPATIYGVNEDRHDGLWMAAPNGIFRVARSDLNRSAGRQGTPVRVVSYGTSDGLRVSECSGGGHPATWRDQDGGIWFATLSGAAYLAANHTEVNALPPPVVVANVLIDDQSFDPAHIGDIPPGRERVTFEYAGLSYTSPQKVRFKYKLEGFDRDWVDAGTRRSAFYTNLPPRQYRFRVLAANPDGVWNDTGATIAFRMLPHFYQTIWFEFLMLCALLLAFYGVYQLRLQQVRAQYDAVLKERNRIAREIHDTLAQGFAGVSVQLEVAHRLLSSSTEAAREHLDQARQLVRRCLADARQSIWELRSQSPEHEEEFAARLAKLVSASVKSTGTAIQLEVHGANRPLNKSTEDELFKIGQEAITNALRHAHAKNIKLDLTYDSGTVVLSIADDGCGFTGTVNATGPNGHFGLKGMRERAEQIQAQLTIRSSAETGTLIRIEAPAN